MGSWVCAVFEFIGNVTIPHMSSIWSENQSTAAAQAALAASLDPALADPDRRAALLAGAAAGLRAEAAAVTAAAGEETGLPAPRLEGELERTARQLEAFAALAASGEYVEARLDPADPEAKPIPRPDLRRMLVPIGPVAVFGASNFPLAFSVAGGDTASALAAGCPVVVKEHPGHPRTSELVAEIVARAVAAAALPAGAFGLLRSAGPEAGEALVERPEIAAVAFTGSFAAGTALVRRAAARPVPIPVFAEMSSLNPLVVTAGAAAARGAAIAAGLVTAIAGSAGQLCTKPGLVFVPTGEAGAALRETVAAELAAQEPQPMLSAGIEAACRARARSFAGLAEPLVGGSEAEPGPEHRFGPRLFATDAATLVAEPALREECFGPVAVFVEYGGEEELLGALGALGGQLTGTVHHEPGEVEAIRPLVEALGRIAGRLIFNGYPTGVAVTPAMQHGGPFPATSDAAHTSVGGAAIARFLRPVAWQDAPAALLPPELRDENPRRIARRIDGALNLPNPPKEN